jgi:GNAT superfamily N-acetyltransferase
VGSGHCSLLHEEYLVSVTNPKELVVRRAARSDLDEVARVWRESALAMDGRPDVPPQDALRSRIDGELQSGWDLHVALRGERVVGLLALKPAEASIDQIFVAPEAQNGGVGHALLNVAKQVLPRGFKIRMARSNERARCFYEAEGLQLIGDGLHPRTGVPVLFYVWPAP